MEPRPIRIVHYGLGAIGSAIARLTTSQRGLEVVGGIDHDPQKVGRDLGDVIGLDRQLGLPVSATADLLRRTHPDVVIHATTSLFHQVYSQILDCVAARASVISTCEELV
ncbi:MAG TPA: dihydrodipicolinate reductase, partial [Roseiflexaceae bacterium]|nr:dihydrodipicolinate reductase [Roseiflexaceae bacterium]